VGIALVSLISVGTQASAGAILIPIANKVTRLAALRKPILLSIVMAPLLHIACILLTIRRSHAQEAVAPPFRGDGSSRRQCGRSIDKPY
jgi:hypothetical protein